MPHATQRVDVLGAARETRPGETRRETIFLLTAVKTRRASLNNLSSYQLRTAVGRSLLADRLTGYPAGPCARIPAAGVLSTTPAVGGYLIPRESAVPKSG